MQITLAQSTFGANNSLQLSVSSIINEGLAPINIKILASDTDFVPPVSFIRDSASLTFNNAVGSSASFLQFWADRDEHAGRESEQHAGNASRDCSGTPTTNPDSFSGSKFTGSLRAFRSDDGGRESQSDGGRQHHRLQPEHDVGRVRSRALGR